MIRALIVSSFIALGLGSASSLAGSETRLPKSKVTYEGAFLRFCPPGRADCAGSFIQLSENEQFRTRGATEKIMDQLGGIYSAYRFHNMTKSAPFTVTGYFEVTSNENRVWGPRTGTTTWFVITSSLGNVPVPRGMPSSR